MLPLLAPLLSVGIGLVDKLVDKTTGEKDLIKGTLSRLATEGNKEMLEAEIQKLSLMVESDKAQAAVNVAMAQRGGLAWRDWLGGICVVAIGYSSIGVPLLGYFTGILNTMLETQIPLPPTAEIGSLVTILFGMLGIGGYAVMANKGN